MQRILAKMFTYKDNKIIIYHVGEFFIPSISNKDIKSCISADIEDTEKLSIQYIDNICKERK